MHQGHLSYSIPTLQRPRKDIPRYGPSSTMQCHSQQEQRDPVLYIHQQRTFIYLTAESMMVLKEILANYRLGVVSHLWVGPQQLPKL